MYFRVLFCFVLILFIYLYFLFLFTNDLSNYAWIIRRCVVSFILLFAVNLVLCNKISCNHGDGNLLNVNVYISTICLYVLHKNPRYYWYYYYTLLLYFFWLFNNNFIPGHHEILNYYPSIIRCRIQPPTYYGAGRHKLHFHFWNQTMA